MHVAPAPVVEYVTPAIATRYVSSAPAVNVTDPQEFEESAERCKELIDCLHSLSRQERHEIVVALVKVVRDLAFSLHGNFVVQRPLEVASGHEDHSAPDL